MLNKLSVKCIVVICSNTQLCSFQFCSENGKEVERQLRVEVNKSIRGKHFVASVYDPALQKEIDFFNKRVKCDAEVGYFTLLRPKKNVVWLALHRQKN